MALRTRVIADLAITSGYPCISVLVPTKPSPRMTKEARSLLDDLVRDGGTEWDGVRNNAARLHLKAMKKGDEAFFYASMTDKAVVGIMRITREAQPDPKDADWVSVRAEPVWCRHCWRRALSSRCSERPPACC